ncbi:MAG: Uma2 family endonuclease [Treponema sp.]|nr:Uma2 family endonuclease [Treponema sp.]
MSEAYAYNDESKFTYADYKSWELKPGERFELIYGVPYAMAAPGFTHQRIVTLLAVEFFNFLKNKTCQVIISPFDVRLFYDEDESDDTVVQPDLTVICDQKKIGEDGCRGAPELAVEILSPSNSAFEMGLKLNLYKEAGVKEYWVVDPKNKLVSVYILKNNEYVLQTYKNSDLIKSDILTGLDLSAAVIFRE